MTQNKTAAEAVPEILGIYMASLVAGDPDRWITIWTEDCIQMPPRGPTRIGKQALYEGISAWMDAYTVSDPKLIGDLEIQEIGDWAYCRWQGSYKTTPTDGSPPYVFEGKGLEIYQRQPDGEWKIHRDCYNWDKPFP